MPTIHLTDRLLRSLSTECDRETFYDESLAGFGVRVSGKTGRKTFFLRYRAPDRAVQRRMTLGTYPTVSLADARDKAKAHLYDVSQGNDPAAEKVERAKAETFGELADLYLERYAKRHKKSWKEDERIIEKDLRPEWGNWKAYTIKRADVLDLLDDIVERGAPVMANRTLALVSKIFNFGIDREILEVNPAFRVPKPGREEPRQRVLTESEIKDFWRWMDELTPLMAATFRLRLLTAQRGIEVMSMRKADLDGEWWTIPPDVSKVGIAHRVPLSPQALAVLEKIGPHNKDSEWVFPSDRDDGHIRSVKKAIQRLREDHGFDWRPHDLRRTAATFMARTGVQRLVISKVLGHTEGENITAVYDRASYDDEKRRALVVWGDRVERIVTGKKGEKVLRRIGA